MLLIDIKEHLIQEIKRFKLEIDSVENKEEANEICYDCGNYISGYIPDLYSKMHLAEELLNQFFPDTIQKPNEEKNKSSFEKFVEEQIKLKEKKCTQIAK